MDLSAVDQFYTNDDLLPGICVYNFCSQSFGAVINTSNPQLLWRGPARNNSFYMADRLKRWPQSTGLFILRDTRLLVEMMKL